MKTLKNTRTALLTFLLLPLLAVECYDEPFAPKLPEATQTGEGMMAAKVNGVVWEAQGGLIGENPEAFYSHESGNFGIRGTYRADQVSSMNMAYDNMRTVGEYNLWGNIGQVRGHHIRFNGKFGRCPAVQSNPGKLRITRLDTIEHIIAGTFEFDGICENEDTVKVRQGRFDVTYSH